MNVWLDFNTAASLSVAEPSVDLEPDFEAINTYLDLVFGYCEGWAPLRGFAERGQEEERPHAIWLEIDAAMEEKAHTFGNWAAREGMAFYVIPGAVTEPKRAKAEDIIQTQVVLVDLDSGDIEAKRKHLTNCLGEPTAIVASGGRTPEGQDKLHLYWKLSEPAEGEDVVQVCKLRHQIALKAGGDPCFQSAHQPIRVAGSVYHKYGAQRLVTFRSQTNQEYHLQELAEAVEEMPAMEGIDLSAMDFNSAETNKPSLLDVLTTPVREGAQDAWTRFAGVSAAIGHYIRLTHTGQMNRAEAWEAICQYNAAMLQPPWPLDRLAGEAQRLWEKHCEKNGEGMDPDNAQEVLPHVALNDLLADDSPMPEDLIAPRLLTPGGMLVIGGAPKVGKSDLLINLLVHMAAGMEFLGFAPPRPLQVFFLQAEIQYHYLRERMKQLQISPEALAMAGERLVMTPKVRMLLNSNGVTRTITTIQQAFPDEPPDIICIDPIRNLFDGGPDGAGENDNNAMLFFLQERVERIRDAINPEAGVILSHHTRKLSKKQLLEDPFQALSGAGSLRSFYSSGLLMYRPDEERSERRLQFELRNGPAIHTMVIDKLEGEWTEVDPQHERLARQGMGEKLDAERRRKHDVILQLLYDEALAGRMYTMNQFTEAFETKASLGGKDTIRNRLSVLATQGYVKFLKNGEELGLQGSRSRFGYLCVEEMKYLMEAGEVDVLPSHYKCPFSGATLPVENPGIWIYPEDVRGN
ncbi:AAA family ATPase [Magnetococcus sp. PR-3]|uniref:AAA family ATPase n=1 Tax=Magnetococcus sp. PR-3 TaxID=3120355 RepID=UPI002FCDF5D4